MKLDEDTRVVGSDGRYAAKLSENWRIWSANGGYLATIALRAAARESAFVRPVSLSCHFLSPGVFEAVELEVVSLRRTRVAESLRVTMRQAGMTLLEAMVWTCGEVDGYAHRDARMPAVPPPSALASLEELTAERSPYPFWANVEERPVGWVPWNERTSGPPLQRVWMRFRPESVSEDPFVEAGRCMVVLDTMGWVAASQAHIGDSRFIVPTLSLAVDFHAVNLDSEWLLSDAWSPIADAGLVATRNQVWSEDGRLLASASSSLLCRPRRSLEPRS